MQYYSNQLAFLNGVARVMDFSNSLSRYEELASNSQDIDANALYQDFAAIGADIYSVMEMGIDELSEGEPVK